MKDYAALPGKEVIERTIEALKANGFEALFAADRAEARSLALSLIPEGSEVMTMASMSLEETGLAKEINESGRFDAAKPKLYAMDQATQGREMRKYGAAPDVAIGSAHAVTEQGTLLIASLTGSQLPAYAYAAGTVIFVVGAQKIVGNFEEGMRRIESHVVPLESERARKAYGLPEGFKTFPSKVLAFNREVQPGRVKVIVVDEALGF